MWDEVPGLHLVSNHCAGFAAAEYNRMELLELLQNTAEQMR